MTDHRALAQLESTLGHIRDSPRDRGVVELLVRRPSQGQRQLLKEAALHQMDGLAGDNWLTRGSDRTVDGLADSERQLTLMSARVIAAIVGGDQEEWARAGDQIFVDLDLSAANLPAGTRLALGEAVVEVTAPPHRGCGKFLHRFGIDAAKFVNSDVGDELNLRGINARVVRAGTVRVGDSISKVQS